MGNQREENERLVHDCAKCDLATQCKAPVPGHGNPNANVMFIGEAPGYHEDRSNRPFVGSSGSELDELYLPLARLERQDVWVDNVVRCKPRGNLDPPQESIDACKDHLDRSIALVDPEFVCLLGRTAVSAVLGEGYDLESWHGFPILGSDGKTYIPMYHPAFGLHSTDAMALIQNDFKSLRRILQGEWVTPREQYSDPDYREYDDYHIEWFKMYLNARPKIIAIDTETAEGEPWCLTFSGGPGHGVMIREGNPESLRVFQEYVNTYRPLILLHNSMFDIPVLRKMGLEFDFYLDTMVMAYLLQDQPQGLKPLAFRHAGMKMEAYWDIIGTATQDRALEYFEQVARREWTKPEPVMYQDAKGTLKIKNPQALHKKAQRALKVIVKHEYLTDLLDTLETSSWSEPDTYTFIHAMWNTDLLKDTKNKKGAMPETLLATKEQLEDKLGRTSIPDLYKRWKDWKADDETWEAEAELGPLHPGNLGDVDPEIALTYACRDADATFRIYPILRDLLEEHGLLPTLETDMKTIPMVLDMQEGGWPVNRDHFDTLTKEFTKVLLNLEDDISRQLRHKNGKMPRALRGFNPGSPAQVQKLLYEHLKLKNPTKKKSKITGEDSAADEVLQALAGAHPVIPLISEWRKYAKLISTYTTRIPRKMDKRGRVHPNIRITRTRTGRLACSNPNLQNIPTRSDEGR